MSSFFKLIRTLVPHNFIMGLSSERLRIDKIKLEQIDLKLRRELKSIEEHRDSLSQQLATSGEFTDQKRLRGTLEDLDVRTEVVSRHLDMVAEGLRVVDRCTIVVDNRKRTRELGRLAITCGIDPEALDCRVEQVHLEEQRQRDQLNDLLNVLKSL